MVYIYEIRSLHIVILLIRGVFWTQPTFQVLIIIG